MSFARGVLPDLTPLRESRSFRLLWLGQLLSQLGSQLRLIALPFQVYLISGSTLQVGLISLFQMVPLILFSLFGGVIADTFDRRRVLIVTQCGLLLTSLALAIVTQSGAASLPLLYALTAVGASFSAVDGPARQSLIPTLVPRARIAAAITVTQAMNQTAVVLGPALGGLILASFGVATAYWIDSLSFLAAIAAAVVIVAPKAASVARRVSPIRSLVEGFRYLASERILLTAMLMDLAVMVAAYPIALFPFYADHVFAAGPQGLGLLYSATGFGALAGVMTAGWIPGVRGKGSLMLWCAAGWGVGILAFGVLGERSFAVALACIAFAFAADAWSAIIRSTLLQSVVRDEYRGRLSSTFSLFVIIGPRLGQVQQGAVSDLWSPQAAVIAGGVVSIAATALFAAAAPSLRRYGTGTGSSAPAPSRGR